ncbi:unnamed protein product [Sphenostylis stenocarpa]|uniref:Uncharacterized protein n=1 Tax=Sphenostylis stenocarpa TaxID=92480 RepID=A0AA86SMJ7_9FABA|nr:unnamed protein product [Sphenostylis stenocarpa]
MITTKSNLKRLSDAHPIFSLCFLVWPVVAWTRDAITKQPSSDKSQNWIIKKPKKLEPLCGFSSRCFVSS